MSIQCLNCGASITVGGLVRCPLCATDFPPASSLPHDVKKPETRSVSHLLGVITLVTVAVAVPFLLDRAKDAIQEPRPGLESEIEIPRTEGDKGRYYLLGKVQHAGLITTLHKRVGVSVTGYSRTEIDCNTSRYRDIGYSESGLGNIRVVTGSWTDVVIGSSKSNLVLFVCS